MSIPDDKHALVQEAYGAIAKQQLQGCGCGPSCCGSAPINVLDRPGDEADLGLSCGNPVAFSRIQAGQTVLDLGSGAGRDAFIAAPLVGADGKVIGVDMTPEMLALARANALKFANRTGLMNVEFRQGYIEHLPLDDAGVDLVISNCVINLSPDKPQVFREAWRVLKPGGEIVVSDIVLNRPLPQAALDSARLYAACISGALLKAEYLAAITSAGFEHVEILSDVVYAGDSASNDPVTSKVADQLVGIASSITVSAKKPQG
jgi:SAM-dependent methyltransferase